MDDITIAPLRSYDEGAVLALYAAVGWTNYTQRPEMLRRAFAGSLCTLCAYDGGVSRALCGLWGTGRPSSACRTCSCCRNTSAGGSEAGCCASCWLAISMCTRPCC